ncbi:MAG: helix-turn-helix domain-containing protein [Microcystis aeruginosa G13-07]|jgi:AraC family ethanolamine operon transcriptional activator|nr:helix-turn-helix domain-containing protein [Microcystis aeruginosa G13-11]NCS07142.1 helix-turn-helix domain-containing protein [Microcystis aeruginosa G13-07]
MLKIDFPLNLPDISLKQVFSEDANLLHQQMNPLNVEAWQLSPGGFKGTSLRIATNKVQYALDQHNSSVKFEGSPNAHWALGIPVRPNPIIFERKYELEDNYVMFSPPRSGFIGITRTSHALYVLNFNCDYLNYLCETLQLPDSYKLLGHPNSGPGAFLCRSQQFQCLRQCCQQLEQSSLALSYGNYQEKQRLSIANCLKMELEHKIASKLLLIIAQAQNITPKKTIIRRSDILKQAEEYMLNNLHGEIYCTDISKAIGVSQRNLQDIFKHFYEITPKAYLKRLRLNHLRQCLLKSSPKANVWEFAEDLGFIHRGQLAQDYQQLFGELPSKTYRSIPAFLTN